MALAAADAVRIQVHFHHKVLVVVRPGLAGHHIAKPLRGVLLHNLLQLCLIVLFGALLCERRGDEGQNEGARGFDSAVEIQRRDNGLERIGHHAGARAPAAQLFAVAQPQPAAQVYLLRKTEQRRLAHKAGAHARQIALRQAGMGEQIFRHHDAEHGIAQKFQALVVLCAVARLVCKRSMGEGRL